MSNEEIINYCFGQNFLKNEYFCKKCLKSCELKKYTRNNDKVAWRCKNKNCSDFKKYFSIRTSSFFHDLNSPLKEILLFLIKYANGMDKKTISTTIDLSRRTCSKITSKILKIIPEPNFNEHKLGGPGFIVQADETMLNYKCKSHRGRSPTNRTDALVLIELNTSKKITRAFAKVIPNKQATTILPIINSQVASSSVIWTDEHRSYSSLQGYGYSHSTVCHKYNFINPNNGTNTQAVESFNNLIKYQIKKQKGIITENRQFFLNEVCFFFNNKINILEKLFDFIKL